MRLAGARRRRECSLRFQFGRQIKRPVRLWSPCVWPRQFDFSLTRQNNTSQQRALSSHGSWLECSLSSCRRHPFCSRPSPRTRPDSDQELGAHLDMQALERCAFGRLARSILAERGARCDTATISKPTGVAAIVSRRAAAAAAKTPRGSWPSASIVFRQTRSASSASWAIGRPTGWPIGRLACRRIGRSTSSSAASRLRRRLSHEIRHPRRHQTLACAPPHTSGSRPIVADCGRLELEMSAREYESRAQILRPARVPHRVEPVVGGQEIELVPSARRSFGACLGVWSR